MIYACSDIHGQYDKFLELLKKIKFSDNDQMYVLGDVIDRGPAPLPLLLYILASPDITLLAGNHEHMMIKAYETGDNELWLYNGAKITLRQFGRLSGTSQKSLIERLKSLPLVIPDLKVGKRHFYLTHAGLYDIKLDEALTYHDVDEDTVNNLVWSRDLANGCKACDIVSPDVYDRYKGHYVLLGHTRTSNCAFGTSTGMRNAHIAFGSHGHVINLDCGAVSKGNIGCLRLDDNKEFYVPCR